MDALSIIIMVIMALLGGSLGRVVGSFLPVNSLLVMFFGLMLGLMAGAIIAGRLFGFGGQGG